MAVPISSQAPRRNHTGRDRRRKAPAAAAAPGSPRLWLELDDGTSIPVRGRGVIGREPAATGESEVEHLVTLADQAHSVSRTHLEFDVDTSGLWVRDLGSTNGSAVAVDGQRIPLEPGRPVTTPPGTTIYLAGRPIRVRARNGRAVIGAATVSWGMATRTGPRHQQNEDSFCALAPAFVVADGMGGHAAGEYASREAVNALDALAGDAHVRPESVMDCLADARRNIGRIPTDGGPAPGTTLSGVIVTHDENEVPSWMVVNVGDSRTYRLTTDGFSQLTVDHTVAQQLMERDPVRFAAARSWQYGNRLTRAVVADTDHQPDICLLPMNLGDRILVCSDGLTGEVDDRAIAAILQGVPDAVAAAEALVNAANRGGLRDDTTALVIDAVAVDADRASSASGWIRAVG